MALFIHLISISTLHKSFPPPAEKVEQKVLRKPHEPVQKSIFSKIHLENHMTTVLIHPPAEKVSKMHLENHMIPCSDVKIFPPPAEKVSKCC